MPSFDCHQGTLDRALEEWQTDSELTARSFSKQPQARIVHWTFGKRRAQQRDRGWPADGNSVPCALQPPGHLKIYAITLTLPGRRLMQKRQSKQQVPQPSTALSYMGSPLSSAGKGAIQIVTRNVLPGQMWHTAELPTLPFLPAL